MASDLTCSIRKIIRQVSEQHVEEGVDWKQEYRAVSPWWIMKTVDCGGHVQEKLQDNGSSAFFVPSIPPYRFFLLLAVSHVLPPTVREHVMNCIKTLQTKKQIVCQCQNC